ncbi:hypothetical protein F0U44_07305 [Nocardioides humilatus]|uniref:CARDB domain-containing protein n=1 Tax=Nocardioides humilatus TaxID=2607660 RepID=A0A5B1LIL0_9ACTN|nr:hypothetical protein [Nocardioides humilatus]KAA1420224.1 hypothetical protein F0U44_07305 [Nocardioides humilatus]
MRTTLIRRSIIGSTIAALAAIGTLVAAAPAQAAPSAILLGNISGSTYTGNYYLNQGVVPGPSTGRTFGIKVVNNGSEAEQYKIVVAAQDPLTTTATLLQGSRVLRNTYYTPPIDAGDSAVFKVKITLANALPQGTHITEVSVRNPETNAVLAANELWSYATYQAGNTSKDIFLKTGTQPYVGGSYNGYQYETANPLKVGSTAKFSLRLKNNGTMPASIGLFGTDFGSCTAYSFVVKDGSTDITALVFAGTYTTAVLAPGAKKDLKFTVKRTTTGACAQYWSFEDSGFTTGPVVAHVVAAAA